MEPSVWFLKVTPRNTGPRGAARWFYFTAVLAVTEADSHQVYDIWAQIAIAGFNVFNPHQIFIRGPLCEYWTVLM